MATAKDKGTIETITLSVSTSTGSFDSNIKFPVTADKDEINTLVCGWLEMMAGALKISSSVTLGKGDSEE